MALQKQTIPMNFWSGVDTKTDPFQLPIGKFLLLNNMVYTKAKRLTKRFGYNNLLTPPGANNSYITTLRENLITIGDKLSAYSNGLTQWPVQSPMQTCSLSVLPLIRNNVNQAQSDTAFSSNGLICTVYTEATTVTPNSITYALKFAVSDSTTGQNFIQPTLIQPTTGGQASAPRVFLLGNYFFVVFGVQISSTYHLQGFAINTQTLAVGSPIDISSSYGGPATLTFVSRFDGVVANGKLYLAWNAPSSAGVKMTFFDSSLNQHAVTTPDGSNGGNLFSVCAEVTGNTSVIYVSYYSSSSTNGYILAVDQNLNLLLSPTQWAASLALANLTSVASGGICTLLYETTNAYSYDGGLPSNFTSYRTCTSAGSLGTATVLARSVGLASKAFIYNSTIYVVGAFNSNFQPTYFLLNLTGNVIAEFAYQNGGGYQVYNLASVTVSGNLVKVSYLFKDFVAPIEQITQTRQVVSIPRGGGTPVVSGGAVVTEGIYTQTGINLCTITMGTGNLMSLEIANNLHFNGGFLWAYDGYVPVEHNFFLYPDGVEVTTTASTSTPTGTVTNGSKFITAVSVMTGIAIGQLVTGTNIPANTYVVGVLTSASIVEISAAATGTATETITFAGSLIAQTYKYITTYEWSDNQGNIYRSAPSIPVTVTAAGSSTNTVNVPTLRLTYKTQSPVKIVLYRWSTTQQTYYQVTSVTNPILNSTTVDSVAIYDSTPDTATQVANVPVGILGTNIIYTNGNVVENIVAPSFTAMALYNSRLFGIVAENRSLLWFSKVVIDSAPVEMSDLLTYFVPSTIGEQQSAGELSCLFPMDDKLIIFHPNGMVYLNGQGPDDTGLDSDYPLSPLAIAGTIGCDNQASIVLTPTGLLFQSDKGIWRLQRGLQTDYVGAPVEDYVVGNTITSATRIPESTQVRFTLDNGTILMYDYFYDQWGVFPGLSAVSSTLYQGLHTLISSSGIVTQETPDSYYDGYNPVLLSFTTGWINPAGLQGYQRAYWLFLLGEYFSPHKLDIGISYDYNDAIAQQILISPTNFTPNFGNDSTFGSTSVFGGTLDGSKEQWQLNFKRQKCQAFQITMQELYDPTLGVPAGAGLSLSGMDLVVGLKKGYPRNLSVKNKIG